jgi:hypothetical protein
MHSAEFRILLQASTVFSVHALYFLCFFEWMSRQQPKKNYTFWLFCEIFADLEKYIKGFMNDKILQPK